MLRTKVVSLLARGIKVVLVLHDDPERRIVVIIHLLKQEGILCTNSLYGYRTFGYKSANSFASSVYHCRKKKRKQSFHCLALGIQHRLQPILHVPSAEQMPECSGESLINIITFSYFFPPVLLHALSENMYNWFQFLCYICSAYDFYL